MKIFLLLSFISIITISSYTNSYSTYNIQENKTDPKLVSLCGLSDTFKEDVKFISSKFNYSNYNTDKLLSKECLNYTYSIVNNFEFIEGDFKFSNKSFKEFNYFTDSSNTLNIISIVEAEKHNY